MKQHARLSASSSHRWIKCPGSVYMSEGVERATSEAAEEGTKAHAVLEAMLKGEPYECDDLEMLGHVQYVVDYVKGLGGTVESEVRIDYWDMTGVEKINGEVDSFGTCDIIVEDGDTVHIIDFKYGLGKVSAQQNTQLFLYASPYTLPEDKKVFCHIVQPRIDWVDVWEITGHELAQMAITIQNAASKVDDSFNRKTPTALHAGNHCQWCPAKAFCRTYNEYVFEGFDFEMEEPHKLTIDEIAKLKTKSAKIKNYLDTVDQYALNQAVMGVEIPGWTLGEGRQGNRKWKNEPDLPDDMKYKTELRSVAEVEKILPRKKNEEIWSELDQIIERAPGKQVLVPVDPTSETEME